MPNNSKQQHKFQISKYVKRKKLQTTDKKKYSVANHLHKIRRNYIVNSITVNTRINLTNKLKLHRI